jgi:hypothetical protein
MASSSRVRWGDAVDDDDEAAALPPPTVTGPDGKGIKTRVEYKRNGKGETVRVTTKTKVLKVEKKMHKVREGGRGEGGRGGGRRRGAEKNRRPDRRGDRAVRARPRACRPPRTPPMRTRLPSSDPAPGP